MSSKVNINIYLHSFQMPTGIPYFSNLNIHQRVQQQQQRHLTPAQTHQKGRHYNAVIGFGLPQNVIKSSPKLKNTHFSEIFPENKIQPQGLLAAAETSAVMDREFAEANKLKFLDLASSETVKNFSKLAQTSSLKFNPLKPQQQQQQQQQRQKISGGPPKPKKRRRDIFD